MKVNLDLKSHLKVMDMMCDNCGTIIDKKEDYCPNCGMELPGSTPKPSKRKYHRDSAAFTRDKHNSKDNYGNYPEDEYFERKPSKKKYYKDSADSIHDIPHPRADYRNYHNEEEDYKRKPLKRKYYGNPSASAYDDPYYKEEVNYESHYAEEDDYEAKKSGGLLGTMFLLLVIALLLGFIIGLILFSSNMQSIPNVPGLNS